MKDISIGTPVTVGDTTIIPLVKVSTHRKQNKGGISVYVYKEPVGIVIASPQYKQAMDIDGKEVPLETYIQEIDGLQQVLDSLYD